MTNNQVELTVQRAHHKSPACQKRVSEAAVVAGRLSNILNSIPGTHPGTSCKYKVQETLKVSILCSREQMVEEQDWLADNRPLKGWS